ncbi:MAG TPA: nicotinamide-nucleotide amidohydrolase family protein, partial [Candidatus Paceibacterota bacterium]|nr:nicotinamide-nucleotide amidohydrolase family protein [Candidatus Paceibacterota bacterium]
GLFRTASAPGWLIMLPGPPRELRPMFSESVIPLLQRVFPAPQHFACKTFRTCGVGESMVQERIEKPMQTLVDAGLELGYCARPGQVDVRLVATGAKATELVKSAEAVLRTHLSESIYAEGDEGLEDIVIRLLTQQKRTVAVAESCTGGFITHRLTNVPGASAVFKGGFVTYSNELKQRILGVRAETLSGHGAVSEAVAREMAEGARRISESDYAISTTGIAGPDGGTPEKPVGTVFIALANSKETRVWKMFNPWDRVTFKDVTAEQALNQLRLSLAGI